MVTLLITAAGVAAFELAAVKYGADSRVDPSDGRPDPAAGTASRRWI